jgi:hypothetical protein
MGLQCTDTRVIALHQRCASVRPSYGACAMQDAQRLLNHWPRSDTGGQLENAMTLMGGCSLVLVGNRRCHRPVQIKRESELFRPLSV